MKAPNIVMNGDKRCFTTQCTYQVETKTCLTFAFLVIYIHSIFPLLQPTHMTIYVPNYQIFCTIKLFLYTPEVLTAIFVCYCSDT